MANTYRIIVNLKYRGEKVVTRGVINGKAFFVVKCLAHQTPANRKRILAAMSVPQLKRLNAECLKKEERFGTPSFASNWWAWAWGAAAIWTAKELERRDVKVSRIDEAGFPVWARR